MSREPMGIGEARKSILTRAHLGRVLPFGWAIEHCGTWYTPFLGDEAQLPPQKTIAEAINAIRAVLATTARNVSAQLQESLIAEQLNFFDEVNGAERSAGGALAPSETVDPEATQ